MKVTLSPLIVFASAVGYAKGALRGATNGGAVSSVIVPPALCNALHTAGNQVFPNTPTASFETAAQCYQVAALVQQACQKSAVEGDTEALQACRLVGAHIGSTCSWPLISKQLEKIIDIANLSKAVGCPQPTSRRNLEIGLVCDIVVVASQILIPQALDSVAECTEMAAEAVAVCETAGGGPEDPFADACAGIIAAAGFSACEAAVEKAADFTASALDQAVGC